jgi:hypothetical protein
MAAMAVEVKKLDVQIGDVVEINDRRYDVVSDKAGGVALEPAITSTVAEIHAEHGGRPLSSEEFEQHFGGLPSDGEG